MRKEIRRCSALAATLLISAVALAQPDPVDVDEPAAAELIELLREGGYILAVRHADTSGMPCDRTYRIGEREGQRNISLLGQEQSRRLGQAIRDHGIPIDEPVLTGPVFRARDTAELAFGVENVEITNSLTADDYAGRRVRWVISEHQRLLNEAPEREPTEFWLATGRRYLQASTDASAGSSFPKALQSCCAPLPKKRRSLALSISRRYRIPLSIAADNLTRIK